MHITVVHCKDKKNDRKSENVGRRRRRDEKRGRKI